MPGKKLSTYHRKRDLERSGEPSGGEPGDEPRFVAQKHDASSPHYDFRLEVDGVLKSWAVPKGPSLDPREKRLATPTEDHPLDNVEFEGGIPEGYGAGTVVVWDTGTYCNDTERGGEPVAMADGLSAGHVKVWLDGEKLRGAFALSRTDFRGREQWLLVKVDDEGADRRRNPVSTQPESVLTGRTNDERR
ncbi:DNA polymerase ligase N-terminal domain-containing protein [Saccharopolyspora pogona]|uniref:DNA polymerase ligase N-terminal domain-containing protein n=1 Tax=Saccharopolyspora pogona TaxID=333966 RepID=UPI001689B565|nr:DNA polymerase ligase N-terminal domain-containing protein [Saccharopolyspora pogona]